ncbi:MAG TPA: hypothetical protein VLH94_03035 [Spirochaetia bacterium]|nr:hypothetical protein [Spirochaetia bacterium]
MTFISQTFADDGVSLSNLPDPAPGLSNITNISGLLTGGGFNLINLVFVLVGLVFFANLIITGWEYMMSTGDPKKVSAASTRLLNAFVGLILAVVAFIVVRLVTNVLGLGNLV